MDNLLGGIIPPKQPTGAQVNVHELKSRVEWGEPAFTVIDVRDRMTYNDGHIMGSMCMSMDQLVDMAKQSLALNRDIYIHGETDEETAQAASQLRAAGFENVSELKGGFPAWKAVGGPTEGVVESRTPAGADDYNVVARIANHLETQQKEP